MPFVALGLDPRITQSVEAAGYEIPTAVQTEAIPAVLEGHDLLVSSHTGSGKTAAFLLPALQRMLEPSAVESTGPRLLVLCPTRELAQQVNKQALAYGKGLKRLRTVALVGGAPFGPQLQAMKANPEVMIATPGRLMDHMQRGRIDFARLETLVLDEADRMLDMGFIEDIEHIISALPDTRQTLLFSATLDGVVGQLAKGITKDARRIEIVGSDEHKADIDQRVLMADDLAHKHKLLDHLLRDAELTQAVIFAATKKSTEELAEVLLEKGFSAAALHGDMPQHKRNRTLQRLRDGATKVLVATDVAARGLDVAGISHVINFDPPMMAEDYVHRIGRTGRAGRSGIAVSLLNWRERRMLKEIERFTGQTIRVEVIPGLEPQDKPRFDKPGGKNGKLRFSFGDKGGGAGRPGGSKPPFNKQAGPKPERKWEDRPPRKQDRYEDQPPVTHAPHEEPEDHRGDDWQPGADAWKNAKPAWNERPAKKNWSHAPRHDVGNRASAGTGRNFHGAKPGAPKPAKPAGGGGKPFGGKPGGGAKGGRGGSWD